MLEEDTYKSRNFFFLEISGEKKQPRVPFADIILLTHDSHHESWLRGRRDPARVKLFGGV